MCFDGKREWNNELGTFVPVHGPKKRTRLESLAIFIDLLYMGEDTP
jgi:hypothetical protein